MDPQKPKVEEEKNQGANPTPPAGPTPMERAEACGKEISAALEKYHCHIHIGFHPIDPVGTRGGKAFIQTSYGIMPEQIP